MYIPTRSIVFELSGSMDQDTLLAAIRPAVETLKAELPYDATGTSITVVLKHLIKLENDCQMDGMRVYVTDGEPVNSVYLGHGLGNLESFVIPPGGSLEE